LGENREDRQNKKIYTQWNLLEIKSTGIWSKDEPVLKLKENLALIRIRYFSFFYHQFTAIKYEARLFH